MTSCGCYYCENYAECGEVGRHESEDIIKARHKDGFFQWDGEGKGRWVNLCIWCRDWLGDSEEVKGEK